MSVIGLYRLVLNQVHCGLYDGSLNYGFTIDRDDVEFKEWWGGNMMDHDICGSPGTCIKSGLNYECPCQEGFHLSDHAFDCEGTISFIYFT